MAECYKCLYRSRVTLSCDYLLIRGKPRGVPAASCDKFKPRAKGDIDKDVLAIQNLYYEGYSDREIAETLNISRYKVGVWRKSNMLQPKGKKGRPKKENECRNTVISTSTNSCSH